MRRLANLAVLVLLTGGMLLGPVAPRWLRAVLMGGVAVRYAFVARRQSRGPSAFCRPANGAQRVPAADGGAFHEDDLADIGR